MIEQAQFVIDAEDCFDEFVGNQKPQEIYEGKKEVYYEENWSDDETNDDFIDRLKRSMNK
jgi:hypothetical protein